MVIAFPEERGAEDLDGALFEFEVGDGAPLLTFQIPASISHQWPLSSDQSVSVSQIT